MSIITKKFLALALFLTIFLGFASSAHAALFSCSDKKIFSNLANLTIGDKGTGGIGVNEITVDVLADPSLENPNPVLQAPYSQTQISGNKKSFVFNNLLPRNFYRVIAFNVNNKQIEEINDCQFTTDAPPDPTASTTVAAPTQLGGPTVLTPGTDNTPAGANTPLTAVGIAPATSVGNISTVAKPSTSGNGLIPCDGADCTFDSVLQLVNNLINFFFTTLLLPLIVLLIMYLGYGYLTANGNPAQHAKLKSMLKNIVLGLLLIVCAWLIVRTLLSVLGYTDDLMFFSK